MSYYSCLLSYLHGEMETATEHLVSELRQLNTNFKKMEAKLPASKNRNNLVTEKLVRMERQY